MVLGWLARADPEAGALRSPGPVGVCSVHPANESTAASRRQGANVSLYKPENGAALNILAGIQVQEYVALQANYIWNQNALMVVAAHDTAGGPSFFEQPFVSAQHAVVGDLLLYFRNRTSGVRPYLSVGAGVVRLETIARAGGRGEGLAPPPGSRGFRPVLRVAVGLDFAVGHAWRLRYSFSESVSGNPIAEDSDRRASGAWRISRTSLVS